MGIFYCNQDTIKNNEEVVSGLIKKIRIMKQKDIIHN